MKVRRSREIEGVTLIELIIVLGLISLVIMVTGPMINFSGNAHRKTVDEFNLQSSMRIASQTIANFTRHGTAVFPILQDKLDNEGLANGWNYFALDSGGKRLVHFVWNSTSNSHTENQLIELDANDDLYLGMSFFQDPSDTRLLQFDLHAFRQGQSSSVMKISSELNAINTARIDQVGSSSNRPVALAYRTGARPDPRMKIAVTFVVDISGSMNFDMAGNPSSGYAGYNAAVFDTNDVRIDHLKNISPGMIDRFANFEHAPVYLSLIQFNDNANNNKTGPLLNLHDQANVQSVKDQIVAITPTGGTNTGDGMRRAYHVLRNFYLANEADYNVKSYLILLMDGDPTYWSSTSGSGTNYQVNDGNINTLRGNGSTTITDSHNYVKHISETLITGSTSPFDISTSVIAFTNETDGGQVRAQQTADFCDDPGNEFRNGSYYHAFSGGKLDEVFNDIINSILDDTWHIYGP
ncbi:VWA domain-containing protein [Anoxynatronum buryatiense]|uniref:Type II secretory pathway, pseudopilin PulG n=1 Tax=Anoxynatronum buryatiense TaxID=489973 RepID=A0AA46AIF9_9CLOT|nr:VWA domain-containing protein [Anoxynatronum buryatiense]SMP48790.1 Type II secretory pathway, pseudopilin PulG [Anoxynatronum buryatiense]